MRSGGWRQAAGGTRDPAGVAPWQNAGAPPMKPTSRGLLLVLAAGLLAQALLFAVPHQVTPLAGDQAQYDTQARLLAAGEALHPNFLWPPLYGRWLSGFYRLFGPWLLPVKLVQVGLLLWAGVLFFRLLEEAGVGRRFSLLSFSP